jgi:hypothetical protein
MRKIVVVVLVLAALAVGVWFLRRDGAAPGSPADVAGTAPAATDPNGPLAYVPADTPYVFANLEPVPAAVSTQWMQQMDMVGELWRNQLASAIAKLEQERPEADELKWMRAIRAELDGKTTQQFFASVGYDVRARFALYGVGLAPVLRLTLADPEKFRGFLARLEQQGGTPFPRATLDGQEYLQLNGGPTAKLRGIVALQDGQLVLTLAPLADDAALRELLGLQKPARSLQDGGALTALNTEFAYLPYGSGYFDVRALLQRFTAAPTPLETAFLTALEVQKPAVDPVCQAEYEALAVAVPRMSFGYTTMDAKRMDMVARIETNAAIAADLRTLRAPMPGLAQVGDSPLNFGLSFKLAALPGLVSKWADAVAAAPWQCASLAPLNESFAQTRQQLANPVVFGAAPVFEGVHAIATRLELKPAGETPDFGGKLLIGSPSPAALVGMAKSFVPQLATLQLAPDGKVHALPALPNVPNDLPGWVAMKEHVLGLAFGAGEDADLAEYLQVDPAQQPLIVLGYSGALFAQFNQQMLEQAAAIADPAEAEQQKQAAEMVARMYAQIRRMEMRVEFGERGIELHQRAEMN